MLHVRIHGVLLLSLLPACSPITVSVDYDPAKTFSEPRTFSWLSEQQEKTGNIRIDSAILDARIRSAVEDQLVAQGYKKVPRENADILIAYHAVLRYRLDVIWNWEYDEGTLVLDIVDPRTQKLQWRGTARTAVSYSATPERRKKRIQEAVRKILEKFPPPDPA